jgi:AAA+ ATPase superfamily predicted ATPase
MYYIPDIDSTPFVGRQQELELLDRLWKSPRAEFLILYGRRRVGKSRLLTHWFDTRKPRVLDWEASETNEYDLLRSLSQAIYNFRQPPTPAPQTFTYATWRQAFEELAQPAKEERLAVFIDEFTYILSVNPAIAGTLQHIWDHLLKHTKVLLVLSGSHLGMMQHHILSQKAPLYGRATAHLKLLPLPYGLTGQYYPSYRADERVAVYAMAGGIPFYWEKFFFPDLSLDENINNQFLSSNLLLHGEPSLMLSDYISDAHNYVAILRAIAYQHRTPKEIAAFSGLDPKHVPAYLKNLIEIGLVERRIPVTALPSSRMGRHHITDPFLRFYYRFLSQRQRQLSGGVRQKALSEIRRHLRDFVAYTWEELCQDWLTQADDSRIPFLPDRVGSTWTRSAQVDVVGINSMENTLILGEAKWGQHRYDSQVLEDLVRKTDQFVPKREVGRKKWRVFYLGFARNGWTEEASTYAEQLSKTTRSGENWNSAGMRLLDLDAVDQDLASWSV